MPEELIGGYDGKLEVIKNFYLTYEIEHELPCDEGYFLNNLSCIACALDHYCFNNLPKPCLSGEYQDENAAFACKKYIENSYSFGVAWNLDVDFDNLDESQKGNVFLLSARGRHTFKKLNRISRPGKQYLFNNWI